MSVIWEPIPADRLTQSGAFTVRGRIDGAPCLLSVAVSVAGKSSAALESLVDDYGKIDTSVYTEESVSAFAKALSDAKAVLSKNDAVQSEIDSAKDALKSAKYNLTKPIYASLSLKEEPPRIEPAPDPTDPPVGETPKEESPSEEKPDRLSAGSIAAIAVGAVAAIGILCAVIGYIRKKK